MTSRRALCAAIASLIVLSAGAMAAPQKPNFAGRWVIVSPPEGAGKEQVITHDDKQLSIGSGVPGGRLKTFQLDGREHKTSMSLRGETINIVSKAVWDAGKLVLTTDTAYPNGMKTKETEIWTLDGQGRLVIDYSETAEGQAPRRAFKVIHTRKG